MRTTTHGRAARRAGKLREVSLPTSTVAAWRTCAAAVRRAPRRFKRVIRPEPGYRRLSLFTRVILVNAAVLVTATLVFAVSPATVSFPLAVREALVLALGLLAIVIANTFLLRLTFRPLGRLVRLMSSIDLLQPGQRLELSGGVEVRRVISTFNEMLERLERERRESNRRTLTAREGERRRIGQELHDEIGQRLTGLLLQLGRTLRDAPEETRSELLAAQDLARSTLDEVGRLAWQLRPGILDDLGLVDALRALVEELDDRDGVRVFMRAGGSVPPLGAEADLVVYRIAQESITNALRHADAHQVELELGRRDGAVTLTVSDDGRGIDGADEGPGIRGMRERALLLGASLRLRSDPGQGLIVSLELPLQQESD